MRKIILFILTLALLFTSMTCQKKVCLTEDVPLLSNVDTVAYYDTDRNDIPPPPTEAWWTIDTSNLDVCQSRLWGYLKRMYPNREEDYWDYEVYSLMAEPAEELANRAYKEQFFHFFTDTFWHEMLLDASMPCMSVDSTFFLQALGSPTCKSYNRLKKETNYFYDFKLRYRNGPCPYIFDIGSKTEHPCHVLHFKHCSLMKMRFDQATGRLIYIDFLLG